jgi:hypothetical protein
MQHSSDSLICAPSLEATRRRDIAAFNLIGSRCFCLGQPNTGEVGYAEVDRPPVNDRIHGSGGTMNEFVDISYDLECGVERSLRVASGEDMDRAAADKPLYNGVNGILEQDGLTDNRADFAVSIKGVSNVGSQ